MTKLLALLLAAIPLLAADVHYRTRVVDGVEVFYREAGSPERRLLVLLHGFPTSSHMFRNVLPVLGERYHVIAPDLPGFGWSAMPDSREFSYTFRRYSEVMHSFLQSLGVRRYALYVTDYGAPVGFRMAVDHPEEIRALVVQNGNAYEEGLGAFWEPARRYWLDPSERNREALIRARTIQGPKWEYTNGVRDTSLVNPDNWTLDLARFARPGHAAIRLSLAYDYRLNVADYPKYQEYFRRHQPPTLVVWGKNDEVFLTAGALAFLRDLPRAEVHLFDTGHFALETHGELIAELMLRFLARVQEGATPDREKR